MREPFRRRAGRTVRGAVAVAVLATALGAGAPLAVAAFLEGATAEATMSTATLQAPSGLSGGACLLGSVTLSWNATPSTWADGYEIRWSKTNGGPYTTGSTTSVLTTKVVTGLSLLTTYYFVVRAYDGNWRSPNSNQLTVGCV
jgi:hypothetical protein